MKFANLPLLQVCLVFFLGVWFGFTDYKLGFSDYLFTVLVLFIGFLVSFWIAKMYPKMKFTFTLTALSFLFSLGVLNTKIHLPKHQKNHYTHFLTAETSEVKHFSFEGVVVKVLKSSNYKDKYEIKLNSVQGRTAKGKILVQIPVSDTLRISSNSKISGFGKLTPFKDPLNPQQFNYKDYMFSQQISHVIDSEADQISVETQSGFSFSSFGEKARRKIQNSLDRHAFTKDQMDIIQALLLGQKQDMNPETYDRFSKAGVVHILAVSGLHVGIVLLILQFITKALLKIKYGRLFREGLVLLGIWGFAALAGFTPSVLRAAVMFSFLSLALNYKRKTSAINTLALSAVFLILINPYLIYHVGFQLSYLAVISIVTLQPRLSRLYQPGYFLDQKIWDIVTVTIAAQLGVLPLSLYYFHQFPGLFLLSNLVILPGLGLIIAGGILVIILSLTGVLPEIIVAMYGQLLDILLGFVNWIASKENLVFADIYYTKAMLISSLILLFSLMFWNSKRKLWNYALLNVSLIALLVCFGIEHRNQFQQEEVLVFQTYKNSQLGVLKGSNLKLYSDTIHPKDSLKEAYHIKNYKTLRGVDSIQISGFRNVYLLNSTEILFVLDSIPVYPKGNFQPDYLLLKNSPDINLDRVLSDLKPKQIIADGSNYRTDIERWQTSAKKLNVNFHSTWEQGAFVFPGN
ncbi:ComEC family competence protein [Psychroflexus sp. YR1-1]|uniref:ComEC family competence protein n=1 Tax=Psychroflexus aurantiacus TaxID=2709310 RepID=A0A6B3R2D4_9FLAO|nr:ComEC/Rec2 family competence protein [Psychroflexus aurantiacus]NEV94422.1 ComEC family competence protein [Psychroflexus aurantiacus]